LSYDGAVEFDKALVNTVLSGDRVSLVDNVTQDQQFESRRLNSALTATGYLLWRILGSNTLRKLLNRSLFTVTGNGLVIAGELPRRFLWCEIDPNTARPQDRVFKFEPVSRAKEIWPELVSAGFTILRAFYKAGKPSSGLPALGSFDDWSVIVRDALVWIGLPDVVETQRTAPDTPEDAASIELLETWVQQHGLNKPKTLKQIKDAEGLLASALLMTTSKDTDSKVWNPGKIGKLLQYLNRKPLGNYKLVGLKASATNPAKYHVEALPKEKK
jgi:putative DNA primase/helicase